jgi:hypothetical protein
MKAAGPDDIIALNRGLYHHVYATRRPLFGLSTVEWDGRTSYRFEWTVLPLTVDGTRATHCLGIDDYSQATDPSRARHLIGHGMLGKRFDEACPLWGSNSGVA